MVMYWLGRFWGFAALSAAVLAWVALIAGAVASLAIAVLVLLLSVGAIGYFLFQYPVRCRAVTISGRECTDSSRGLLIGCTHYRHKWQRLNLLIRVSAWPDLRRTLWSDRPHRTGTAGALVSAFSGLAALVIILVR
jgi:hypothetical protein